MAEYPEFKFSQSSAALYLAMEEHHPEVFKEVQKYVKKGQWEIVGGRWSEGDTNMVTEEGHVRQFLLGQRYFREKFGVDCKVGWEPDTFGHTWQMPQMLLQAGIDSYYFCRAGKKKPLFHWEGPDGSKVLAFDEPGLGTNSWYNSDVTGKEFKELTRFYDKYGSKDMMWVYGVGNHGGGPTLENIKTVLDWQKSQYLPQAKFSTATEFFDRLKKQKLHDVETFRGELNAVFEGCYTTHSRVKKYNRDGETEAVRAETAAAIASRFGFAYPRKAFWETWKDIAWNHHHDTLPGSSIHKSYELSHRLYQQGIDRSRQTLDESLEFLGSQVAGAEPNSLMVLNTLGWRRDAVMTAPLTSTLPEGQLVAISPSGEERPVQRTAEGEIVFVATDLPAFGYRVYKIGQAAHKGEPVACKNDGATLSSPRFDLELDAKSGCVTRLYDKKLKKELASKPLNDLVIHWEGPHGMAAWEIGPITKTLRPKDGEKIEVVEVGPVRARVRVKRGYNESTWSQDVILYRDLDVVEFALNVDWKEKGAARSGSPFLRALFPLSVADAKARYAIPFGDIERPQPARGNIEAPQGAGPDSKDVAALTWADVANAEHGVALLNDCKHGYQSQGGTLRLSLLRASWEPDPIPDVGQHVMRYALVSHEGSIHDAGIPRRGIEFNHAPAATWLVKPSGPGGGKPAGWNLPKANLKKEMSFLSVDAKNVIPTSLKVSEDGSEWIVRFYESSGAKTETSIACAFPIEKAERVNFIEDRIGDADPAKISLRGYEIQTLKLRLAK
jgi:alpha-mannosidase